MHTNIARVRAAVESAVWAILPEKALQIAEFLSVRAEGPLALEDIQARIGTARPRTTSSAGMVAVLPVYGVISHRMDMLSEISGGTSVENLSSQFAALMDDPDISAIVLDVDSPGGTVAGVDALAKQVFEARGKGKRIVAVSNALMASAAYWIGAQADEVIAEPGAMTGNIGALMVHTDRSGAEAKAGIKTTMVAAGKFKTLGNPHEPLSEEARDSIQAMVDEAYDDFVSAVARGRGVSAEAVRSGYGEGKILTSRLALRAGLVDRIATLDEVVSELAGGAVRPKARGARAEAPALAASMVESLTTTTAAASGTASVVLVQVQAQDAGDAGGAAAQQDVTPATSPAPVAKEHTVDEEITAAANGAATDRAAQIAELCALHELPANRTAEFIRSKKDVGTIGLEIAREKAAGVETTAAATAKPAVTQVRARAEDDPRRGFRSHRDFLVAAMENAGASARSEVRDERLRPLALMDKEDKAANGAMAFLLPEAFTPGPLRAAVGSDEQGTYADRYGGFAVPTTRLPGMLSVPFEGDPTAGRTQPVPMATPTVEINARTDKDHTTSVSGGFTVTRRPETVSATSSRMQTEMVTLKATGLFGLAYATEELLTDSPISFAALIESGFRDQFPAHLLNEKIRGGGGNEFMGILNASCKVEVAKETGQAAATIVSNNVIKMAARSWGFGQAIWLANHDTRPQLATLSIAIGTGGVLLYQPATQEGFPDMLWGRPVFYTEYMNTVGSAGDLALVNFSQYLEGLYQPLQSAESVHVRFVNHERCFKFWLRNAGAPWWRSALTPAKGTNTLSPIVTLAVRS